MKYYTLDKNHNVKKVSRDDYAQSFQNIEERRVAETTLINGKWISTVFLGIDHNYLGGKPHLFETMVFDEKIAEVDMQRYSTWDEAVKGHEAMVKKYSNIK